MSHLFEFVAAYVKINIVLVYAQPAVRTLFWVA
jgi:hypothetical protein